MPAQVDIEAVTGTISEPVYVVLTNLSGRFRSDQEHLRDTASPLPLPPVRKLGYAQAALAASTSPQSVTVSPDDPDTAYSPGDLLIVDAGTDNQEVVEVSSVTGAAITAIFRHPHGLGSPLEAVTPAGRPKILTVNVKTRPAAAIANIRFRRATELPAGVYDAYRVLSSYPGSQESVLMPSTDQFVSNRVPPTLTPVYSPTRTTVGRVSDLFIEVRQMLTAQASNNTMRQVNYLFGWDEA